MSHTAKASLAVVILAVLAYMAQAVLVQWGAAPAPHMRVDVTPQYDQLLHAIRVGEVFHEKHMEQEQGLAASSPRRRCRTVIGPVIGLVTHDTARVLLEVDTTTSVTLQLHAVDDSDRDEDDRPKRRDDVDDGSDRVKVLAAPAATATLAMTPGVPRVFVFHTGDGDGGGLRPLTRYYVSTAGGGVGGDADDTGCLPLRGTLLPHVSTSSSSSRSPLHFVGTLRTSVSHSVLGTLPQNMTRADGVVSAAAMRQRHTSSSSSPPPAYSPVFVATSCHNVYETITLARQEVQPSLSSSSSSVVIGAPYNVSRSNMWLGLLHSLDTRRVDYVLHLGDQVYVDKHYSKFKGTHPQSAYARAVRYVRRMWRQHERRRRQGGGDDADVTLITGDDDADHEDECLRLAFDKNGVFADNSKASDECEAAHSVAEERVLLADSGGGRGGGDGTSTAERDRERRWRAWTRSPAVVRHTRELFRDVYRLSWGRDSPATAAALSRVSNLMIFDDHDVTDDLGDVVAPVFPHRHSVHHFVQRQARTVVYQYMRALRVDVAVDDDMGMSGGDSDGSDNHDDHHDEAVSLRGVTRDYSLHVFGGTTAVFLADVRGVKAWFDAVSGDGEDGGDGGDTPPTPTTAAIAAGEDGSVAAQHSYLGQEQVAMLQRLLCVHDCDDAGGPTLIDMGVTALLLATPTPIALFSSPSADLLVRFHDDVNGMFSHSAYATELVTVLDALRHWTVSSQLLPSATSSSAAAATAADARPPRRRRHVLLVGGDLHLAGYTDVTYGAADADTYAHAHTHGRVRAFSQVVTTPITNAPMSTFQTTVTTILAVFDPILGPRCYDGGGNNPITFLYGALASRVCPAATPASTYRARHHNILNENNVALISVGVDDTRDNDDSDGGSGHGDEDSKTPVIVTRLLVGGGHDLRGRGPYMAYTAPLLSSD